METKTTEHTPLLWHLANETEIHDRPTQWDESGARIGETPNLIATTEREVDAAYIVQACNAYPALLEALEEIIGHASHEATTTTSQATKDAMRGIVQKARAALAATKEE